MFPSDGSQFLYEEESYCSDRRLKSRQSIVPKIGYK